MKQQGKRLDFSKQELFIGLDVHKRSWTVTIRIENLELKTFTMKPSSEKLKNHMEKHYPGGNHNSVYEAGFSGYWLHRELTEFGFNNIIVSPTDIPTSGKERLRKTDKVDSRKLARELSAGNLKGIYVPSLLFQELRGLSRQRYQQTKKLIRIKNQIKGYLSYYGQHLPENCELQHWSKKFINHLGTLEFSYKMGKEQLENYVEELLVLRERKLKILQSLKTHLQNHNLYNIIELLLSVPGIGYITAITLLTEIVDIHRFKNTDSFASYIGLVPSTRSSGEKDKVLGLTVQFNRYLRQLLVEASWVAVRNDPALTLSFNDYSKRMCKQKAIIKIARRLLNRIYYVLKNEKKYVYSIVA